MPALAPTAHKRLHLWKAAYVASETEEVIEICGGDSRSTHLQNREWGSFVRQMDVKHSRLVCPGNTSANGEPDGLGQLQVTLAGITNACALPGGTLPGSGIVNRYPVELGEAWTTGVVSSPHFSRYAIIYASAGGSMNATAADDTGGTFKRGDPAQGRNIASIERFAVTDNRLSTAWLASRTEFGYGAESGAGAATFSAPPSAPGSNLLITPEVLTGPFTPTTGTVIQARHRHSTGVAAIGTGLLHVATAINYAGSQGMVFACVAQGGWSSTDHMADPSGGFANADWKYHETETQEWLTKVMKVTGKKLIVRLQVGQNGPADSNFGEWNGTTAGNYAADIALVANRWIAMGLAAGAASVLIVLESVWQSGGGGDGPRIDAYRAALSTLADAQDNPAGTRWVFFDMQAELIAGGYSSFAGGMSSTYTPGGDPVHQNFAGMNLLGSLRNAAVMGATAPTSGGSGTVTGVNVAISVCG